MSKKIVVALALFTFCLFAPAVHAAAPVPTVNYSADMETVSKHGETTLTHVYSKGMKQRMETGAKGRKNTVIMRLDMKKMWMLMPDQKIYMEMPIQQQDITTKMKDPNAKVEKKFIKNESVDGHPCKEYFVTVTNNGKKDASGYVWEASDLKNMTVKWQDEDKQTTITWKKIDINGQIADSLFEVPSGYQKMDMSNMGAMGAGRERHRSHRE